MYEVIAKYKDMTDAQRQELLLAHEDQIISEMKLDKMREQVEEANQKRLQEEQHYEGKLEVYDL